MKIQAYLLIGLLGTLAPALALDGDEMVFKKVEVRTDYGTATGGDKGKICIDSNHIRFVDKKDREYFSIPSDAVTGVFYSRVAGRRIGAAIVLSPLLLFSKGKKHYLTLSFDDGDQLVGAIEFKLHKSNYRGVLRAAEAVSGVDLEFDQEGIKGEKETVASRGAATSDQALIKLTSSPEGADIEIDGAYAGSTPRTKRLKPGEYKIKFKKRGYKDWEKKITVAAGEEFPVHADLEQD